MQIIGVTGMSGAGKSTVSKKICELINAKYIDADKIAKELSKKEEKYYKEIVKAFGNQILDENLNINRKVLAKVIFSDKEKMRKMNDITYKIVVPKIKEEIGKVKDKENVVIDVPLLFESKLNCICDKTIGVIAKREICLSRISKRDNISEEEANARINAQNDNEFFARNCDVIINNDDDENIDEQIKRIL